jgi:hypothetical protein
MPSPSEPTPRADVGAANATRACPSCRARLALDNPGPLCSPCWQRQLRGRASTALRAGRDELAVRRAFNEGGVPRIAEALDVSLADALDVALLHKLVPAIYRRRTAVLVELLELGPVPHVVAAEQLGVSRWTIATYRRDLGINERARPSIPGGR